MHPSIEHRVSLFAIDPRGLCLVGDGHRARISTHLQVAINRFLANSTPKPFVWTADPKRVLAAVKRGKEALESIH
jgi:hypothetical protein